jgi:hypothetical protein
MIIKGIRESHPRPLIGASILRHEQPSETQSQALLNKDKLTNIKVIKTFFPTGK